MKTITAKNLRDNLDEVVRSVRRGESIRVTYRSQPAFVIQPDRPHSTGPTPGSAEAMTEFVQIIRRLSAKPRPTTLDPNQPIKQQYRQMLDKDPKYKGSHD